MDIQVRVKTQGQEQIARLESALARIPQNLTIDANLTGTAKEAFNKFKGNVDLAKSSVEKLKTSLKEGTGSAAFKQATKETEELIKSLGRAANALEQISGLKRGKKSIKGFDTNDIISQVTTLKNLLAEIGTPSVGNKNEAVNIKEATKAIKDKTEATKRDSKANEENKKSLNSASEAAAKYRAELNNVQVAMRSTSQFASQMREDIQQAFSYYALKQFLGNLIEIGGQFEYQRRAIANILQDTTKANTLFNQIKELGVRSPFSTLQLDSFAKQLSAFDVPYNEMYDKLKKLADISAGTGADMSRIILAYGHVKAEGFLTGVQRRQFSNANINMVGGLADYYSKQEGHRVTTRDVYKRIHDKQVSFEDMDTVLMKMAEEGGQFYQMQEVMADSVKGVYKNLQDALNHAYMSIEQSTNGPLMAVGKGLQKLLGLVEKYPGAASRFIIAATAMAGVRALSAKMINQEAAATVNRMVQLDKEMHKLSKYKALGDNAWYKVPFLGAGLTKQSANKLALSISEGGNEGQALKETVRLAGAQRQLNMETLKYLQSKKVLTEADMRWIKMNRSGLMIIRNGYIALRGAIGGLIKSFGPMIAISLAIEGIAWAWNKFNDTEGKERRKKQVDALTDSYNSLKRAIESLPESTDFETMDRAGVINSIKEMANTLKDEVADAEIILGRIFKQDAEGKYLFNTVQQAQMLRDELEHAKDIQAEMQEAGDIGMFDVGQLNELWGGYKTSRQDLVKYLAEVQKSDNFEKIVQSIYDFTVSSKVGEALRAKDALEGINHKTAPLQFLKAFLTMNDQDVWNAYKDFLFIPETVKNQLYVLKKEYDSFANLFMAGASKVVNSFNGNLNGFLDVFHERVIDWITTMENLGITDESDQIKTLMTVLKTIPDINAETLGYMTDYIYDTFYPEQNNIRKSKVPNQPTATKRAIDEAMKPFGATVLSSLDPNIDPVGAHEAIKKAYKESWEALELLLENSFIKDKGITKENLREYLDKADPDTLPRDVKEAYNTHYANVKALEKATIAIGYTLDSIKPNYNKSEDQFYQGVNTEYRIIKDAFAIFRKEAREFGYISARETLKESEFRNLFPNWDSITGADFERLLQALLGREEWDESNNDHKNLRSSISESIGSMSIWERMSNAAIALKTLEPAISKAREDFSVYSNIYKMTGSQSVAAQMAYGEGKVYTTLPDILKDAFNKNNKISGKRFDEYIGFTDEQWQEEGTEVRRVWQQVMDLIIQYQSQEKEKYATLLAGNQSYKSKKEKIESEYQQELDTIENGGGTEEQKAKSREIAKERRNYKLDKLFLDELNFLENIKSFDATFATEKLKNFIDQVERAENLGIVDTNTAIEETNKATDAIESINDNKEHIPFVGSYGESFIKGGISGLKKYVDNMSEAIRRDEATGTNLFDDEDKKKNEKMRKRLYGKDMTNNGKGGFVEFYKNLKAFTDELLKGAKNTKAALDLFTNMFDALGNESMANAMGDASGVLGGALSGSSSLSFLGLEGKIAGAAIGTITAVAQTHDKSINRSIENSKRRIKELKSDYKAIEREQGRKLTNSGSDEKEKYNNLVDQKKELDRQLDLEREKKKEDKDAIRELEDQIGEMEDKIKYYWSDLLKEIYGLDFSSIADKLTDALTRAFENGENAAIAWRQAVGDIVRELACEILAQKYVKPMMDQLFEEAFGPTGKLANKTKLTEDDVKWLGDRLNSLGEDVIPQAEVIYKALQQAFPYSANSETVGGFTRLGEQLTEKTGTVLAGYINSIRADVSANRKSLNVVVERGVPALEGINAIAQSQLTQLNSIATNTKNSAQYALEIRDLLAAVTDGNKEFWIH